MRQIIMITDGKPSALTQPDGRIYKNAFGLDPFIVAETCAEVRVPQERHHDQHVHARARLRLVSFVRRVADICKGKAYFTTPYTLGQYVLMDYWTRKPRRFIKVSDLLPLFPLPNVVLFPDVFLPLHIFEARYRDMVADAVASDRMIGMVLLRPGWERDYDGRPPLYRVGCSGVVTHVERLPDGRYNLVLRASSASRFSRKTTSGATGGH